MTKEFFWNGTSGDKITVTYSGTPTDGSEVSISSITNLGIDRTKTLKVLTIDETKWVDLIVNQTGLREIFICADVDFILRDGGTFNVLK